MSAAKRQLSTYDRINYGAHSDVERLPESSVYRFVEFTWRAHDGGGGE